MDMKSALRNTLTKKQELVRDYQSYAGNIDDPEVSKMYKHFAESEALHAKELKEKLDQLK